MSKNLSRKSDTVNAEKLFEKWKAELQNRNRDKDHLFENFDDLWYEFKKNGIEDEVARTYIKQAVAKHLPDKYIMRRTYQNSESSKYQSETEFFDAWKELIDSNCINAYYNNYPMEAAQPDPKMGNKIQLPKGMSREEYSRQRKHVQQFPIIDLNAIEQTYKEAKENNEKSAPLNFDDILGDV